MERGNIIAGAIIIAIIAGGLAFYITSTKQSPSDCTVAETYSYSTERCEAKSGNEYAQELAKIEEETEARIIEEEKRSGKRCISASEALNYIGVNGCVRMEVQHCYIEPYGWAWLDSSKGGNDFSVAALANGIITRADADYYIGKTISVRGTIELYKGEPEIKITSKDAIFDVESLEDRVARLNNAFKDTATRIRNNVETLSQKRSKCFDEGMKNAKTAEEKTATYNNCKNP